MTIKHFSTVHLHPLVSVETKDGAEQIMGGYYGSVKATTESLASFLKNQYDVQIQPATYYNHASGEDKGSLQLGNTTAVALNEDEVEKILKELPGRHVFIGAGKITRTDNLGSLACAEFILTNPHNIDQAYFTFIADLNASEEAVENLASKNPGKLLYTWPEMNQEKYSFYTAGTTSCKFIPLPGRPVKPDYNAFKESYDKFSSENQSLVESKRPLVVMHIPGNAGGIPFTTEQAKAYTQNAIWRYKETSPVFMVVQGNRTDNAVLETMQEVFEAEKLNAYEQGKKKDFDFCIFDKKSIAYKASFLISQFNDRPVTIEIDVNSSAITGELNFASFAEPLLISAPGVLEYKKALDILKFYNQNGHNVLQQQLNNDNTYDFELQKAIVTNEGRDKLNGGKIAETLGNIIAAHIG